jgi:phosphopantothenoylcysteine decarboxylase/phosphopantothenate--cysteine ligase
MRKKNILITAGPTREYIDPVRYISNQSSGVLGYALAEAAIKKGYAVTLISGPTALVRPKNVTFISVTSAHELEKNVVECFKKADILFMTSAVCDYRPEYFSSQKIKRKDNLLLRLVPNNDILKKISKIKKNTQTVCGFCIETKDLLKNAKKKISEKNLDYIVATKLDKKSVPFGHARMSPVILAHNGKVQRCVALTKKSLANKLVCIVERGL